jgi:hypothetical protein
MGYSPLVRESVLETATWFQSMKRSLRSNEHLHKVSGIGCFQIRLRRMTPATIKALVCFCLPPPKRAGKSTPPAWRLVVEPSTKIKG